MLVPSAEVILQIAAASLSLNVCFLLTLIVSRVVTRCKVNSDQYKQTHRSSQILTFSSSETVLSCLCLVGGLYAVTSPTVWTSPFEARDHDAPSTASEHPTFDAVRLVLTAVLGRFAFSFGHLSVVSVSEWKRDSSRGLHICSWLIFRGIYIVANILCLTSVVVTDTNYLVGSVILLLEADQLFEEATRCWNLHGVATSTKSRMCLFIAGLLLIGFRITFPVTIIAVSAITVQRIMILTPLGLGVACFSVVFYTLSSVFLLRRHLLFFRVQQRATLLRNVEAPKPEVSSCSTNSKKCLMTRAVRQCHQHPQPSNAVLRRQIASSNMKCLHGAAVTHGSRSRRPRSLKVIVQGRNALLQFIKVSLEHARR